MARGPARREGRMDRRRLPHSRGEAITPARLDLLIALRFGVAKEVDVERGVRRFSHRRDLFA
jgi:hypothetical protein